MGKRKETKEHYLPMLKRDEVHVPAHHKKPLYVLNVFQDSDLRIMEFGMTKLLARYHVKVKDLPLGTGFLFINTTRTYVKMLVGNGTDYPVVLCKRMPAGKRFPMTAARDIAKAFGHDDGVGADEKLSRAIDRHFPAQRALPSGKGSNESGR